MPTKIEWTDESWNPATGCTEVSPGCHRCYAKTFAERWRGVDGHYFEQGFDVVLRPERLDQPQRWTRPRRIFVNSMSDLFHDDIDDAFIADVFTTMTLAPQHTYQLLTKRHGRMRALLTGDLYDLVSERVAAIDQDAGRPLRRITWPLPQLWLGVSVEDQKRADLRVPALLATPAAVRWLSCEPLLGPVDLNRIARVEANHGWSAVAALGHGRPSNAAAIDWVVAGGESGRGARPMHPDWARTLRDQCLLADVPYFLKQWGAWMPATTPGPGAHWISPDGTSVPFTATDGHTRIGGGEYRSGEAVLMRRVPKNAAGSTLDGRIHRAFPALAGQVTR